MHLSPSRLGYLAWLPLVLVSFCWMPAETRAQKTATTETEVAKDIGTREQGEDWATFLGPRANGISVEKGISQAVKAANGKLRVRWRTKLGPSYGSACISRGRALIFDRDEKSARLRCVNAETGKPLWDYTYRINYEDMFGYNSGPRCTPVTDGRLVYVYGPEGKLHCVRLSDGEPVWKRDLSGDYGVVPNFFGVGSTPVIYNDMLIVMVGGSPDDSHGLGVGSLVDVEGDGSGIVALDKRTGKEKYKITDELASYATPLITTVGDRDWAFVLARGGLVAFEPKKGKVDFQFPWRARINESVNASSPVVVGSEVFITETYGPGGCLLAFADGQKEKVVWKDEPRKPKALPAHWNTPVFHKGFLYGSAGRHTSPAELRCVEWKTGNVQWRKPGLTRSSLTFVDDHFVCLGEDGAVRIIKANPARYEEVALLDLMDGEEKVELEYPAWAAPVLSHGLLYMRGKSQMVCTDLLLQEK